MSSVPSSTTCLNFAANPNPYVHCIDCKNKAYDLLKIGASTEKVLKHFKLHMQRHMATKATFEQTVTPEEWKEVHTSAARCFSFIRSFHVGKLNGNPSLSNAVVFNHSPQEQAALSLEESDAFEALTIKEEEMLAIFASRGIYLKPTQEVPIPPADVIVINPEGEAIFLPNNYTREKMLAILNTTRN